MLVNRKNPKWWQIEENDGELEVSLGPGYVTPGFVGKLQQRFGLSNVRIRFGSIDSRYDYGYPLEYPIDGDAPTLGRKCKTCGSEHQVSVWKLVKEKGKSKEYFGGEKYRWSYSDRRGLLKDVTFHATVPRESFEPFYRFMEHLEGDRELPMKVCKFLKEASP